MQGFHSIASPIQNDSSLNRQIASVIEEIRNRQLQKHASGVQSELLERATLAFKEALIEMLVGSVQETPCHLARQRRHKGLGLFTRE
ncbi:MAG: hypothetical protein R3B47_14280 [Bacteroidia bacterium]